MTQIKLTRKELSIMRRIGQGKSVDTIRRALKMTTADELLTHIASIAIKLNYNAAHKDDPNQSEQGR